MLRAVAVVFKYLGLLSKFSFEKYVGKTECQSWTNGRIIVFFVKTGFMFEKLLSQIRDSAAGIIDQHPDIPADKKSVATDAAITSISEEVDRMMDGGDFSTLEGIRHADSVGGNATIKNVVATYSLRLQQQCQLDNTIADNVSAAVMPALFVKMKEKFSGGGLDVKSLMSSLSLSDMMKLMSNMGKLKDALGK